jgi:hypothetical protein
MSPARAQSYTAVAPNEGGVLDMANCISYWFGRNTQCLLKQSFGLMSGTKQYLNASQSKHSFKSCFDLSSFTGTWTLIVQLFVSRKHALIKSCFDLSSFTVAKSRLCFIHPKHSRSVLTALTQFVWYLIRYITRNFGFGFGARSRPHSIDHVTQIFEFSNDRFACCSTISRSLRHQLASAYSGIDTRISAASNSSSSVRIAFA